MDIVLPILNWFLDNGGILGSAGGLLWLQEIARHRLTLRNSKDGWKYANERNEMLVSLVQQNTEAWTSADRTTTAVSAGLQQLYTVLLARGGK
jgi:hypothetical protein